MSQPWERREGETSKAFAAFCVYRDLGPSRSVEKAYRQGIGRESAKIPGYFFAWASRYGWEARGLDWDVHLDSVRRQGIEKAEGSVAMRRHLENTRRISADLIAFGLSALALAQRSVGAYANLPAEAVQPSEASGLARSALASLQIGLDAEAHSLGVETVVSALEGDDG